MQGIEEDDDDPRLSLVKQLLEYKRYKGSTLALAAKAAEWEKGVFAYTGRVPLKQKTKNMNFPGGTSMWDLLQRFPNS